MSCTRWPDGRSQRTYQDDLPVPRCGTAREHRAPCDAPTQSARCASRRIGCRLRGRCRQPRGWAGSSLYQPPGALHFIGARGPDAYFTRVKGWGTTDTAASAAPAVSSKHRRIHESLSFRAAVRTAAGEAAAAHTDESKVRFARGSPETLPLIHRRRVGIERSEPVAQRRVLREMSPSATQAPLGTNPECQPYLR